MIPEGRKPNLYFLSKAGAQLLVEELGHDPDELDWKPSDNQAGASFVDHLLATNEIRIATTLAAAARGGSIELWIDDKSLRSRQLKEYVQLDGEGAETRNAAVVPDGYFLLNDGRYRYHHFIEADRGTVTGQSGIPGKRSFERKVKVYLEYWRSGLFQKSYQAKGFRVLTVTTSQKRLEHLKEITEQAGGRNRFWFTTFDQVTPDTILTEPIWQVATAPASDRCGLMWDTPSPR